MTILKLLAVWLLISILATLLRSWLLHLKYGPPDYPDQQWDDHRH